MATEVQTIGSKFSDLKGAIPMPHIPNFTKVNIGALVQPAITIAILAGIESLLSAVVADGMTGDKHDSNQELIAQGIANIASALFGGLPATGAIARTATNIKNGGRTPVAGMVHAIVLFVIMIVAMPLAKLIPMATLSAILIVVSFNMCQFKEFVEIGHTTKTDLSVLALTFLLTVVFDLVVAIEVGMVLAMFMFMKKMAETFDINTLSKETENDTYKYLNDDIMVYELAGPMFFGASTTFMDTMKSMNVKSDILILRMRNVPMIDATSLDSLHHVIDYAQRNHIVVLYCELNENTYNTLKHFGCEERMGKHKFFDTMDEAYAYAEKMVETKKEVRNDIDKTNKEALLFRAYIYMQRRDYKGARIDYNTLLQEEPGNNTARLGRALLNQKELKYRESLEDFNKLVSDNPRDVSYLKARATLAVEMNTPDLALLDLEEAAKLAPDDAEIYVMCGEIYLSQKKKREAYVAFEKAIELGVPRPELQDKLKASK